MSWTLKPEEQQALDRLLAWMDSNRKLLKAEKVLKAEEELSAEDKAALDQWMQSNRKREAAEQELSTPAGVALHYEPRVSSESVIPAAPGWVAEFAFESHRGNSSSTVTFQVAAWKILARGGLFSTVATGLLAVPGSVALQEVSDFRMQADGRSLAFVCYRQEKD